MKCPKCRLENPPSAQRCDCGYDFESGEMKRSYLKDARVPQIRPWVRFFARSLDLFLWNVVCWTSLRIVVLGSAQAASLLSSLVFGIAFSFSWIFIEALLLSSVGSTPGKWLLKVTLRRKDGTVLPRSQALARSFQVWWQGQAGNVPGMNLVAELLAYQSLRSDSITAWDRRCDTIVIHGEIGPVRAISAAGCFVILFFLGIAVGV